MSEKKVQYNNDWFFANPEDLRKFLDNELAIRIENVLKSCGKGEENAIKMRQIKERLGLKSDRKIRLTIEAMRLSGRHTILSSTNGYWYSGSPSEARRWSEYMKSYIKDISHVAKAVEQAAIKEYGEKYYQIPLDLN